MRYQQATLKRDYLKIQLHRVRAELTSGKLNFSCFDALASPDFIQNQIALYHSKQAKFVTKYLYLNSKFFNAAVKFKVSKQRIRRCSIS